MKGCFTRYSGAWRLTAPRRWGVKSLLQFVTGCHEGRPVWRPGNSRRSQYLAREEQPRRSRGRED
jgi:hypothetical protein